jgi:hypothetical protein
VAVLSINTIAHNQINRAMNDMLTEGGKLEAIDIGLLAGRVELNGLTVNPPKDHGTDPLLSMGNLVLDVVPTSLLSDVIVVEEVTLKGMSINLVRDKQGRLGLDKLVKAEKPAAEKPDAAAKEKTLPVVQVNKIRLEDGSITVQDSALTGKPMVFPLTDIHVAVDQLRLFEENKGGDPAAVSGLFPIETTRQAAGRPFWNRRPPGPGRSRCPSLQRTCSHDRPQAENTGSVASTGHAHRLGGDGLDSGMALALNDGRISLDALALDRPQCALRHDPRCEAP